MGLHLVQMENNIPPEVIQTVVNNIGDGVVACDMSGKFVFYNLAATELIGPDVSGDSPTNWTDSFGVFLPDKTTPFPVDQYPLLLGLKGIETNEVEQFLRNSARPEGVHISISGRPMRSASGQMLGSVAVMRDISKRKLIEETIISTNMLLADRNAELAAVNKELESFSYAVSHDLRTPLRSIIGFSSILLKKFSDKINPEGLDYLTRIKDSGEKLGQLIDGLLDLSRLTRESLNKQRISLSLLANSVAADLKNISPDRRVEFIIAEDVMAEADQRLMRSVIQNLMSNAWKFTATRPVAKIEFGVVEDRENKPTYFIKDNGVGFNEKYSEKLFVIFQRLHSNQEFEGNGIGLATVQRIISRHGGRIWAEGRLDEGATFYFTI